MNGIDYDALNEQYQTALDEAWKFLRETDYIVVEAYEGVAPLSDELKEQRQAARATVNESREKVQDIWGLQHIDCYPEWRADISVTVGERYRYDGTLYKCIQAHTTQTGWTPDKTPALWAVVSLDEWPEWVQPTGAQDAYNKGDKVSHNSKHWTSDVDANVWEPGIYGWTEN